MNSSAWQRQGAQGNAIAGRWHFLFGCYGSMGYNSLCVAGHWLSNASGNIMPRVSSVSASASSVDRLLKKHRLEHHAELIHDKLEPAVRIDVGPEVARPLKIGCSKFGGLPHLAEGTPWPVRHNADRPLQFLAQINLKELPLDLNSPTPLPRQGWLYFWWDSLQVWQDSNTRLSPPEPLEYPYGLVTYAEADASLVRTAYPEFPEPKVPAKKKLRHYRPPDFGPYAEHRISFRPVWSMEKDALHHLFDRADDMSNPDAAPDEWDRVSDMVEELHGKRKAKVKCEHRLLGSVMEGGGEDMREGAQLFYSRRPGIRASGKLTAKNRKDWIMLSLLGSAPNIHRHPDDAGWLWCDAGQLCYWIRRQDLEKGNFAKAVAVYGNSG